MNNQTTQLVPLFKQAQIADRFEQPSIGDVIDQWSLATLLWLFKSKQDKSPATIKIHLNVWLDFFCPNPADRPFIDGIDQTIQQAVSGGDQSASMISLGSAIRSVIQQDVIGYQSAKMAGATIGIKPPWFVDTTDVLRWQVGLEQSEYVKTKIERGKRKSKNNPRGGPRRIETRCKLTRETIAQRIAALSSFYIYVSQKHIVTQPDGRNLPLHDNNPVAAVARYKIDPYDKAIALNAEQVRALLTTIVRNHSVSGLRDFAMFSMYLFTGRRNSEIRELKWGDLSADGTEYKVSTKGHKYGSKAKARLIPPVRKAIVKYLEAANRLETIQPDDYIFVVHSERAKRLVKDGRSVVDIDWQPGQRPISMREVGRLLKKYARHAGLNEEEIHVHVLRHTATDLYSEAGDDLEKLSAMLGHANINTTRIYRNSRKVQAYASWKKVEAAIGMFDDEDAPEES